MPPKRSWRKEHIIQWLNTHNIDVPVKAVKAELLDIAMKNLPEKRYETDEAAKKYNVDILRISSLPIKHCLLNPVELAWAGLKQYVRDNNVNFRLSDVRHLAQEWMLNLKTATVTAYLNHVYNIEEMFKKSDAFTEQLEEDLLDNDNDDELDSEIEEMID
ncbi:unnamed protein product [Rotaria sp. Silwood2]|nr:unnamed protein product [Rotaria sp. Silwood2]